MGFGIGGITLSTSLVTLFNAVILGYFITKKMKMNYKILFLNLLKMIFAGVLAGIICYLFAFWYDKFVVMSKIPFETLKIILVGIVCLGVYIPINLWLKMEYANELFDRLRNKLAR